MNQQRFSTMHFSVILALAIAAAVTMFYFFGTSPNASQQRLNSERHRISMPDALKPGTRAAVEIRSQELIAKAEKAIAAADLVLAKEVQQEEPIQKLMKEKTKVMWNTADKNTRMPTIPLADLVTEYQVVELKQNPDSYPSIGDQVALPMLNGKQVMVDVQDVSLNPNGDYTWKGHIQGSNNDYPVVFTYGSTSTFASISTAEGSFSLETVNGVGWLYKNPGLADMATSNSKDYLEPKF